MNGIICMFIKRMQNKTKTTIYNDRYLDYMISYD